MPINSDVFLLFLSLNRKWYLYTTEFYSATKKNEILSFAGKRMELENIIVNEVSQVQKAKGCIFSLIYGIFL
jgi:hypothetical protein